MMYVLIGNEKCNQCNILKNLLDEKRIQYSIILMCYHQHYLRSAQVSKET
jgi:glutaredoxin